MIMRKLGKIHLLPVAEQRDYKTLLLTFKSMNDMALIYLQEL